MQNFIFISPNFPESYRRFCAALKRRGFRVLGIGDCPYGALHAELKEALCEYYKVDSLENYDEVYRAVAFFAFKYGKIDWLESNNEYWLEQDARLRDDFNITTGFHTADMPPVKYKSKMKARYAAAGIPAARYRMAEDYAACLAFLREAGRAVIKPDPAVAPGMLCGARIVFARRTGFGLPAGAVALRGGREVAFVVGEGGEIASVEVRKGATAGAMVEVLNPEAFEGKRVVAEGMLLLNPGDVVKAVE